MELSREEGWTVRNIKNSWQGSGGTFCPGRCLWPQFRMLKKPVLPRVAKSVKAQRLEEVWPVRSRDDCVSVCTVVSGRRTRLEKWPRSHFTQTGPLLGHAHDCLLALPSYIAAVCFPSRAESSQQHSNHGGVGRFTKFCLQVLCS